MKNLKIGTRLGIGFGIVLLLLAVLMVTAIVRMETAAGMTDRLIHTSVANQRLVSEWAKIIEVNGSRTESAYKMSDPADEANFQQQIKAYSARSGDLQDQLAKNLRNADAKAQFDAVLADRAAYSESRTKLFKLKAAGDAEQSKVEFNSNFVPKAAAYLAAVNKLASIQITAADAVAQSVQDTYTATRTVLIVLGLLAIIVGVLFAWFITRSITTPINAAVKVAQTVSAGDLTSHIVVDSTDETGQLMHALKGMNDSLVNIVGQVRGGTDTIATASREIAAGNMDLSSRTEQQASSLEETASSMEELTSTVKQNAANARQANMLAIDAADIASRGGAVVADVVTTMGSINASSKKIVDIISVIDGIAFQTNILALNAAVEAARAGEQGRGFAVVATEVRNLAQRSAAAAKEIKGLIDDSVNKVEAGSGLVDKAGQTMSEIVASIGHVTSIMNEITNATDEQSAGIEQVNQAITEMDQVTQQNAALVEQASAAAEAMQDQAAQLADVVSVFTLTTGTTATRSAPPPRRAPAAAPAARPAAPPPAPRAAAPVRKLASVKRAEPAGGDEWEEF